VKQRGEQPDLITCEAAQRAIALAAMASSEHEWDAPAPTEAGSFEFDPRRLEGEISLRDDLSRDRTGYLASAVNEPFSRELLHENYAAAGLRQDLPGSEQATLAQHLSSCRSCQAEMAATTAFFRALANSEGPEPSATLLARARLRLDATLDSSAQASVWTRLLQQLAFTGGRLRAAPALSSALLFAGLLAGSYAGYHAGHAAHAEEQNALLLAPPAPEVPSVVADVSGVSRDPGTGLVEVRYDRLVPDVLTAPATDPSIRELLMAGAENGTDPQVRDVAVSLLGGNVGGGVACAADSECVGSPVRNALMSALATDKAPEVRREALAGLEPFIAEDMEVRNAVLGALMNDGSASVRAEAVRLLQPSTMATHRSALPPWLSCSLFPRSSRREDRERTKCLEGKR
jgi:hypothetical protein